MDVTPAAEGGEAVELCRNGSFDVILCDHRMAGMDGTEVFAALAEIRPDLLDRFVFMSGDVMNPELAVFAEQHGTRMLEKPFLIEDVVRLVREVVAARAAG
jgi:CheY-like chemotaxis protein